VESGSRHSREVRESREQIVQRAYALLDSHAHFRGCAARFDFACREDTLIVRGAVPTFYLKQVLQSVLKDVEGVSIVENQVQVSSAQSRGNAQDS
jgi:hypothetical protein